MERSIPAPRGVVATGGSRLEGPVHKSGAGSLQAIWTPRTACDRTTRMHIELLRETSAHYFHDHHLRIISLPPPTPHRSCAHLSKIPPQCPLNAPPLHPSSLPSLVPLQPFLLKHHPHGDHGLLPYRNPNTQSPPPPLFKLLLRSLHLYPHSTVNRLFKAG